MFKSSPYFLFYMLPDASCKSAWLADYCGLQEKSPDYDTYCMLAEAFMAIQEPDKAARSYEVCKHHSHKHPMHDCPVRRVCSAHYTSRRILPE